MTNRLCARGLSATPWRCIARILASRTPISGMSSNAHAATPAHDETVGHQLRLVPHFNTEITMKDWTIYINKTKKLPPRQLLVETVNKYVQKNGDLQNSLDLGAGGLRDTNYLAKFSTLVTSVDNHKSFENKSEENINFATSKIEDFDYKGKEYAALIKSYAFSL